MHWDPAIGNLSDEVKDESKNQETWQIRSLWGTLATVKV